jgi:hypothetical protein
MSNFSLDQLTEGIRQRHIGTTNKTIVEKWTRTGLLRGLDGVHRENMARLLENQASQVLKEAATLEGGQVRGFTNVAFPIVRRVFGGLVANELVSIQPMSLPSGLLFYMDYSYGSNLAGGSYPENQSLYGQPSGKSIRQGADAVGGLYDLAGQGFTRTYSQTEAGQSLVAVQVGTYDETTGAYTAADVIDVDHLDGPAGRYLQYDPQLVASIQAGGQAGQWALLVLDIGQDHPTADLTLAKEFALVQPTGVTALTDHGLGAIPAAFQQGTGIFNLRRLNQLGRVVGGVFVVDPFVTGADARLLTVVKVDDATDFGTIALADFNTARLRYPLSDEYQSGSPDGDTLVVPSFESDLAPGTPSPEIPEIDIKVEAVPVVAQTRKLRARWSPELAQDLNAYHSLDAEVELTQILSEQIALEIDREILNDLLTQATAANYYWSRSPGKFVNKETGASAGGTLSAPPVFRGTVREWYETLVETIIDVANQIHRKTLRGAANFIVVSPDVATVLESSVMYKPVYTIDGSGQVGSMTIGAEKVGSLSNRFTVYKDPYFPRNKILVGYKGSAYLESGYVYAPYVPLIVTPTIFAPEDFTPRKGVMTRYGKKMVRADFFGTVTCLDMNVI